MIKLLKFSFQIPNCLKYGEEFISQEECQKYMAKCTATNKYPCTDCEWIFDSLPSLTEHTESSHIVSGKNLYQILMLL